MAELTVQYLIYSQILVHQTRIKENFMIIM